MNLYFNFSFQHSCCPTSNFDFYRRNISGGKVMFSLVSVYPQTGGYAWSHVRSGGVPAWSQVPSRGWLCPGGWVYWREVYQGVRHTRRSDGSIPEGAGYAAGVCIPTSPQALTTTTHTVGKRAVRILLECFLVVNRFSYDYDLRFNFESSVN